MSGRVLDPASEAFASPTIGITDEAWRQYRESIACNAPETVALIGGRLDDPSLISDFYFMPPPRRGDLFAHGPAHIEIDHAAMNYMVDRVLVPNGKYMLGLWHSHPGGYSAPSEPDLRLCTAILRNDDSAGRRWPFFIAPITTFDADGRDRVTMWVLRKGAVAFEPALFAPPILAPVTPPKPDVPSAPMLPTDDERPAPADAPASDPMAANAARLGALLERTEAVVGVPRYRIGEHLHAALRIAEYVAELESQP